MKRMRRFSPCIGALRYITTTHHRIEFATRTLAASARSKMSQDEPESRDEHGETV